ncbi:hypothetical protein [Cylindrospermopsis raciborskii]|nr:hypothetical protein [Cylindrospermopsis raciborskii]
MNMVNERSHVASALGTRWEYFVYVLDIPMTSPFSRKIYEDG